jgi:hypothetical protein
MNKRYDHNIVSAMWVGSMTPKNMSIIFHMPLEQHRNIHLLFIHSS